MDEHAPSVLDRISDERRSKFDNNLARVIAKSLEKRVEPRYQSADEMHEAIYSCLVDRGEAMYRCNVNAYRCPLRQGSVHTFEHVVVLSYLMQCVKFYISCNFL
jgi:hypothetical protein